MIGKGHGPHSRPLKSCHDTRQVISFNANIAISEHDNPIRNLRDHIDKVRDFWVGTMLPAVHDNCHVSLWSGANDVFYDWDGRVTRILYSEDDRCWPSIILTDERHQILTKPRFGAMQRLQDHHRGVGYQRCRSLPAETTY